MLSIKKLPLMSASKIHPRLNFDFGKMFGKHYLNVQCHRNFVNLCKSASVLYNLSNKSRSPQLRQFTAEYKAACNLLKRSNYPGLNSILQSQNARCFQTSSQDYNKDEDNKDKKKKDEENNIPSLFMKVLFWMFTTFVLVMMSSVLVPNDNNQNELIRYVSWNEFVYSMLSKGEVEELIVRPDMEIVTIILYEGAVIKGKKTNHRIYHMNVGDIHRFEEKLRAIEQNLGVKESKKRDKFFQALSD